MWVECVHCLKGQILEATVEYGTQTDLIHDRADSSKLAVIGLPRHAAAGTTTLSDAVVFSGVLREHGERAMVVTLWCGDISPRRQRSMRHLSRWSGLSPACVV